MIARSSGDLVTLSSTLELWELDAGTHRTLDLGTITDPMPSGLQGDLLAVSERGGGAGVFDLAANEWVWRRDEGSVSLSGDYGALIAGDAVQVVRADDGALLAETRIPELRGAAIARLSPDGRYVGVGGQSLRRTWLWAWLDEAAPRRIDRQSANFAMGPAHLIGSGENGEITMAPYAGGPLRLLETRARVLQLDVGGDVLVTRSRGAELRRLADPEHPTGVVHVQRRGFNPVVHGFDGGLVLTSLDVAQVDTGADLFRVRWRRPDRATSEGLIHADGLVATDECLCVLNEAAVLELDPETMGILRRVPLPAEASAPTWLAVRGDTLAVLGVASDLWTWRAGTWTRRRGYSNTRIRHTVVVPFGDGFLISGESGVDRLRADAAETEPWAPSQSWVRGLAVSPDGSLVATAEHAGDVVLRDAEGREVRRLGGHERLASGAAFSPDGRRLATSDGGGWVMLWDPRTGERLQRWHAHRYWVNEVLFSPDGTILATASDDSSIRLWTAETATLRRTLELDGWAMPMAFGPDGRHFFYPDEGRVIRVDARATIESVDPEGLLERVQGELGIGLEDLVGEL